MALYDIVKALVQDNLPDNIDQLIIPSLHRDVENRIIDDCGAAQVYVNPLTTDSPGTPQNPVAYIALPGVYTNFGGLEITAPLGVLKWNGTAWSVTQLPMPSGYNYFRAISTAALVAGSVYTTLTIAQANGGWTALPGEFVQLVNRRTGKYDFVQLTAALGSSDVSITFKSRTLAQSFPVGSIVEVYPQLNMRWWAHVPVSSGGFNFVNVPSTWRMPPVETIDPITYLKNLRILKNGFPVKWVSGTAPVEEYQYAIDTTDRTKIIFSSALEAGSIVQILYWQPSVLEEYIPA